MLFTLVIISILFLLFVPQPEQAKGCSQGYRWAAVVQVLESQAELFELNHYWRVSLSIGQKRAPSLQNNPKPIRNTMLNIRTRLQQSRLKAFSLIEPPDPGLD